MFFIVKNLYQFSVAEVGAENIIFRLWLQQKIRPRAAPAPKHCFKAPLSLFAPLALGSYS